MPLSTRMVGARTEAITHSVDDRWLMAYAAGIDDLNPRYMDPQAHALVAHPVFPVCLEWPVILTSRKLPGYETVTPAESAAAYTHRTTCTSTGRSAPATGSRPRRR